MTSRKLAALLGVSPATVSMALNGKPGVNEETRRLVLEAAREHQVFPRSPSGISSQAIYFFVFLRRFTAISYDTFTGEIFRGMEETFRQAGYRLIQQTVYGTDNLIRQMELLSHTNASGILLYGTELLQEDLNLLPQPEVPIVLVDNHSFSRQMDSVKIDNINSVFHAVHFLINRTHCQPGYLKSSFFLNNFQERETGFYQALDYHGMSRNSSPVHLLHPSIEGACADMTNILNSGCPLASCYFADDDIIAIGAMKAFSDYGLSIPEDVSIIGFDDIAMSSTTRPPLTTMHVPKYHLGTTAAKRLLSDIRDPSYFPVKIEMAANLVVRKTI